MAAVSNVLGFVQVATSGTAAALSSIPAGTQLALIQAESANVRWRADGTDPTSSVGMIILAGAHQPLELSVAAGLRTAKFISESGSPKLNITYIGNPTP